MSVTLTRPKVGSGDGELCTLLVRLTLGVVVVEDTTCLSSCNTALRRNETRRELLPFKKFQIENFLSEGNSSPRPQQTEDMAEDFRVTKQAGNVWYSLIGDLKANYTLLKQTSIGFEMWNGYIK